MNRLTLRLVLVLPCVVAFGAGALGSPRATPDPIEGKWYGMSGFPGDRVEVGFEFKRDASGALKAYLYEPVNNFYGLEVPGAVEKQGAKYLIRSYGSAFTLVDGRLEGTYMPMGEPTTLQRVEQLPSEVPLPAFPAGPEPRWRAQLGGAIYAPAAARDGVAYVGTTSGVFDAIRVQDGSFVWAVPVGRPVFGEALATDDAVYFTCDNGYLFKLARADGKELWRYDLGGERVPRVLMHQTVFEWDYRSPKPALADGVLYVGSADGSFHAVDAASGQRVWRHETKGRIRADALVDGAQVIFGNFDGLVVALERATGKQIWVRDTHAFVNASPALVGDRLIIPNRGGLLSALDPDSGAVAWSSTLWGSAAESTAVPFDDRFYIGASDLRRITCYDPTDGRVIWRTDIYGVAWARPVVTDKIVYAGAAGFEPYQIRHLGGLCALERASGKLLWRWDAPRGADVYESGFAAGPTLTDNTLLAGSMGGILYAFPIAQAR